MRSGARQVGVVWLIAAGAVLFASPAAAQLRSSVIASGFRTPVAVVADPLDATVLFVVEQTGLVRVVREGVVQTTPFLDLRGAITTGGERGLLGLAFPPDAALSRRVYVNFTDLNGATVVARFIRDAENPLRADPLSRFDLQWPDGRRSIPQPFSNHNGGHLVFGPDTYLYIGLGDGGSGGDPQNNAQNPQTLLGKMLRLDVSVGDDDPRGYRVPDDNPFVDGDPIGALTEIWAFGFRNPWRYSFDDWTRGGTGALTIADVGQNAREEVNFEPRAAGGRNYGWRLREGRQAFDGRTPAAYLPLTEPIHDYGRATGGSITGGFVYRGAALDPRFHGRYFFADFISGGVFSIGLHLDAFGEAAAGDEENHSEALGGRPALGMVSSFGVDHEGELLVVNYTGGRVLRVDPDLTLVPDRPLVSGEARDGELQLMWTAAAGVPAVSFLVEIVRNGAVVERVETDRLDVRIAAAPGDCARVRGRGRDGAGPAAAPICAPVDAAPAVRTPAQPR